MKEPITDHDIQLFFDAAEKLLNAAERDGEKARTATVALSSFIEKAEARLQRLENDVISSIHSTAETTANRTAELLSAKFQQADKAAAEAARKYQEAVDKLNVRTWLYFLSVQAVIGLVAVTFIMFYAS
ncbi:hypothetical protein [Lelliottia wanjuensis]|uniref:Uncharacterized protein n=1 Tax=Lelliottia wanjuensis TaxID=3050585 RepID=A0AAP4D5C1_9ENTR|nr:MULTISPECIES: hypothetical protein [unclassified Lelliottia]MDK9361948.1 hypothetical protein [Lelliottia sp. V106_12]MDK9584327.1 hypothetical protein [Lelliottia sp. V86_10]MDK9617348.1 hypothetical protein [Lelliottia sp. V106_9]